MTKLQCNSIYDLLSTYGVEAARQVRERESEREREREKREKREKERGGK